MRVVSTLRTEREDERTRRGERTGLTTDCAYGLLGNVRRRETIRRLQSATDGLPVSAVAEHIAETTADDDPDDPDDPDDRYRPIYVSLQQHHIPRLVETDVVRYDPEGKRLAHGPRFEELASYLGGSEPGSDRATLTFALSAVGLALVVGAVLGPPAIGSVGTLWPLVVCLSLVLLTTLPATGGGRFSGVRSGRSD
jgi:hypothetical protein